MTNPQEAPTPKKVSLRKAMVGFGKGFEQMKADLTAARADRDKLLEAVKELVACKQLKDRINQPPYDAARVEVANEYARRKPLAWEAAKVALASVEASIKGEEG